MAVSLNIRSLTCSRIMKSSASIVAFFTIESNSNGIIAGELWAKVGDGVMR